MSLRIELVGYVENDTRTMPHIVFSKKYLSVLQTYQRPNSTIFFGVVDYTLEPKKLVMNEFQISEQMTILLHPFIHEDCYYHCGSFSQWITRRATIWLFRIHSV
jgi:spore cortex formation protein SpoVR/YcgB (stage V sporulation)